MTEGRQTVAGAYAKIEGHEELCAERMRSINEQLAALFRLVWKGVGVLVGVLFMAMVGTGVELYRVQVARLAPTPQTVFMQQAPSANAQGTPRP